MIYQSLKEKQRQEREGLILQATQDLLLERGYYDTSMGEIAARVGVAKGTLYQHFESKEALMIALFKREFHDLQVAIEQIILMPADAQVKLTAAIDALCQQIAEKHPLFFILRHTADLETELHVEVKDSFAAVRDNIATILDQGKDEGAFNPALPTEVMLEALFGIIVSRLFKTLHHGIKFEYEDLVGSLKCIYFHGITAAPAS
jgi:AcrR family transcriptional regulator